MPGDVLRPTELLAALEGIETAYYLVHSMGSGGSFSAIDRRAATAFGRAARAAGVRRIVYLGGLGEGDLSEHLASRQEAGRSCASRGCRRSSSAPRSCSARGSASFEMLRALVERLPVMVTPRWVGTRTQPIAIEDVLAYLLAALDYEPDGGEVFEIGGADVCSYLDLMHAYADRRGLRRHMVPVPVLTPRLSSLWLHLVTPVHAGIGRELVESLRTETVVRDPRALEVFSVRPRTSAAAVARALAVEDAEMAETRWTDPALSPGRRLRGRPPGLAAHRLAQRRGGPPPGRGVRADPADRRRHRLVRRRRALAGARRGRRARRRAGLRRGRRDPVDVQIGDAIDFWRVEGFEQDRLLRLAAEMRMPGRAWLQFEVEPTRHGGSTIRQTAVFDPAGVAGLAYWYSLWPMHDHLFGAMLRQIAAASAAT